MSPLTEATSALAISVGIALLYLILIRLIDLNEREPLWSVGLLFLFGATAAAIVSVLVRSSVLELTVVPGALAEELGKFLAIWAGLAGVTAVARIRGWSEIHGLMDGIIYGAAAGLGYATGETFLREIRLDTSSAVRSSRTSGSGRCRRSGARTPPRLT